MLPNFLVLAGCALIPLLIGLVYYHPNVLGKKWQIAAGLSDEQFNAKPKWYSYLIQFVLYMLLSFGIFVVTVHANHVLAITGPDMEAFKTGTAAAFMAEYGNNFRTLEHGITHGLFIGFLFFALPILARIKMYENKSMAYLWIHGLYWLLSLTIMACIISKWGGVLV